MLCLKGTLDAFQDGLWASFAREATIATALPPADMDPTGRTSEPAYLLQGLPLIFALKIVGGAIQLLIVALALAITIAPRFLDRIYYDGPPSDHYDGRRFFNPEGDADTFRMPAGSGGRANLQRREIGPSPFRNVKHLRYFRLETGAL